MPLPQRAVAGNVFQPGVPLGNLLLRNAGLGFGFFYEKRRAAFFVFAIPIPTFVRRDVPLPPLHKFRLFLDLFIDGALQERPVVHSSRARMCVGVHRF